MSFKLLLIINAMSSLVMTGVIWVIQLVHYPSFRFIDSLRFKEFERFHSFRISIIVIPLMFIELISSFLLVIQASADLLPISVLLFILNLTIWGVTFYYSAPTHQKLLQKYNVELVEHLISTNWLRTLFWTLRSVILILLLGPFNYV